MRATTPCASEPGERASDALERPLDVLEGVRVGEAELLASEATERVFPARTATQPRSAGIGGRLIVRGGGSRGVDEPAILAEGRELGRSVLERHEEAFALGDQLLASVRAGWLEALKTDVGINRSVPLERR